MQGFLITIIVLIPFAYILHYLDTREPTDKEKYETDWRLDTLKTFIVLMALIITLVVALDHFGIHITLVGPRP